MNHVADSAFSVILGTNKAAQDILDATYEALEESVKIIAPGVKTGDIGYVTQSIAKKHGYDVIKEYSGHGCGIHMHEDPQIYN
jgi:methionyl aminopeptidase